MNPISNTENIIEEDESDDDDTCEECQFRKQDKAGLVWNDMNLCEPCYAQYDAERLLTENIIEEYEEEEELTCDDCECYIKANQYRCYAVGCVTYCVCLTCYTKWIILNKD